MATAFAFDATYHGPGATLENYNKILDGLKTQPGGPHPGQGCLFHWVTEIPNGFRVTDVWKTKGHFDTFFERLGPVAESLGVPQPEINEFDVANYLTAAS